MEAWEWTVSTVLLAIGAGAALAIVVLSFVSEHRRRRAMRAMARRLGLRYERGVRGLSYRPGYSRSARLTVMRAHRVLFGAWEGHRVWVLDCSEWPRWFPAIVMQEAEYLACFVLEHEGRFPQLLVQPRRRTLSLGMDLEELRSICNGVEFESAEFAKAFRVRSGDRKFAYDICHPRMMAYLLAHPDLSVEIQQQHLALSLNRRLKVEEIPERLQQLVEIRKLMPDYLFDARTEGAR